ncbi:hypothetical protein SprV_0200809600 [Sparganum proliferum]
MPGIPAVLQRCRTFMFDCDGTLWSQTGLTPGATDFIMYAKNTKSNEQYYEKCRKLGLPVDRVIHFKFNDSLILCIQGPMYVIGEEGLSLELSKVGISCLGIGIQNVLVGYDSQFNYVKCMKAATLIGRGCKFYATNEDSQLPAPDRICPGAGSIVAAVRVASGKDPIVFGKPHKAMFDYLVETVGICSADTAMVGDRLDTDILFANKFGLLSICVLTGATTEEGLSEARRDRDNESLLPDLVYLTLVDLCTQLMNMDKNPI